MIDSCSASLQEENEIPSCDLSGFVRPGPVIVASPLSTFYRSAPENGPIIPETQVSSRLSGAPWWRDGGPLLSLCENCSQMQ